MTHDDLIAFRRAHAECELALFVDAEAGTVLASDAAVKLGQEHLEALLKRAQSLLGAAEFAVVASPRGAQLFTRGAGTALCTLWPVEADLFAARAAARAALEGEHA